VLTPPFGILADRYGTGRCLVFGGVVYVAGIVIMALGDSLLGLYLGGGVLVGIGVAACGFPLVLSAVARAFPPERRSFALGIASSGGSVGQFLLLPFTQMAIGGLGWVEALLTLAALSALIVPLSAALAGRPAKQLDSHLSLTGAVVQAGRHRGFRLLTSGFFVCGFHVAFVATHLPAYINSLHFDPLVGATALSLIGFFNIIGGLTAGYLGGRYRKKYLLSFIYVARAVAILGLLYGPRSETTIFVFSGVFGLLWLSTVPLTSGVVGDIFGARYLATLFGIVMFGHQMGAFFGAWLGGVSYDLTGSYEPIWLLAVALGLLAAVLHWPIPDRAMTAEAPPATVAERS